MTGKTIPAGGTPLGDEEARTAVTILTGFLGSGKTTLLNRLLTAPGMTGTLVIVNEFGEVGLDHLLIEAPREETILLRNGCLCCTVLGDMVTTLTTMLDRRAAGDIEPFDRIVVETSGLADPTPLLQTIINDEFLSEHLRLGAVLTVVDAVNGQQAIDQHFESTKQVAAADRIFISKTDIASEAGIKALRQAITSLNPGAEVILADTEGQAGQLSQLVAPRDPEDTWRRWGNTQPAMHDHGDQHSHHRPRTGHDHEHGQSHGEHDHGPAHAAEREDGIKTISVTHNVPATRDGLRLWMNAISRFKGPKLLRVKGIVNVEGRPYAVNAVQRVFHEPLALKEWPSDERVSRIVFIAKDIDQSELVATTATLSFRPTQAEKMPPLDFAPADYKRFVSALSGFTVEQRL